jgi:hypothetical protein
MLTTQSGFTSWALLLTLSSAGAPGLAAAGGLDLLVNGDAATGTVDGWSPVTGYVDAVPQRVQSSGTVVPGTGLAPDDPACLSADTYFFSMAGTDDDLVAPAYPPGGAFEQMAQTVALIPGLAGEFTLSGCVQTEGDDPADGVSVTDYGAVEVRFVDAVGQPVGEGVAFRPLRSVGGWSPFVLEGPVPADAVAAEVVLTGELRDGAYVNVFWDSLAFTVEAPSVLAIDIKPGSDPNPINLGSRGVVPVAILGSEGFDPTALPISAIHFAGAAPDKCHTADVAPADGYTDLFCHFRTQSLDLTADSTEACVTIALDPAEDALALTGCDSVRIVPPKAPKQKPPKKAGK